jgi:protein involved in polysaccharide export with SLBB domain
MNYRFSFMLCAALGTLSCPPGANARSTPHSGEWHELEDYEGRRKGKAPRGRADQASRKSEDSGWIDLEEFTQGYEEQRSRRIAPDQSDQDGWVPLENFIPGAAAGEDYSAEPSYPETGEWTSLEEMLGASALPVDLRAAPLVAGDNIKVEFRGIRDMSGIYKISEAGTLEMPLIGTIRAGGMVIPQLEETLEQIYERNYLNNPKITAALQPRPLGDVSLKGLINLPGDYAMEETLTLAEVMAKGAGATGLAFGRDAVISRRRGNRVWVRRVALDYIRRGGESGPDILPGDLINVIDRRAMPPLKELDSSAYPLLNDVLKAGAKINF